MSNDMKQNRYLEIAVTSDESDDSVVITSITFRRDGEAGTGYTVPIAAGAASATGHITALGETIPNFSHIKIIPTHVA